MVGNRLIELIDLKIPVAFSVEELDVQPLRLGFGRERGLDLPAEGVRIIMVGVEHLARAASSRQRATAQSATYHKAQKK